MTLLSPETKRGIKRVARTVGLLEWANRVEYAYGNRITRRVLEFYRPLIPPGALCFDIGAHYGRKTLLFRELGARVIAVEPMAECCRAMRQRFASDAGVTVVEAACGATEGRATLNVCTLDPQTSTLHEVGADAGDHAESEVAVTTLDALIARHGEPAFCKIDAEGFESAILAGLSHTVRALSLEYHRDELTRAEACVQRLSSLGFRCFNYSRGSEPRWAASEWHSADELLRRLAAEPAGSPGDFYALRDEP